MKDTILYISDREERVASFLKNLCLNCWNAKKEYLLDLRHDILITDKVDVVGNIGNPYTTTAFDSTDDTVTVAEISSFQLETIHTFKPDVSAVLNITPDHLNRHYTMECYTDVKMSIAKNQDSNQPIVLNYEDPILREYAGKLTNRIIWFSSKQKVNPGVYLEGKNIIYADGKKETFVTTTEDTTLVGIHNVENIMAAIAISINMDVPVDIIRETIRKFKAVPHRIEYVETINDVIYYNDSKGTNTDASIKAIEAMSRPTILIAGGYDKKVSFDDWAEAFGDKVKCLVLLGQTAEQIADTVKKHGFTNIIFTESLKDLFPPRPECKTGRCSIIVTCMCKLGNV